MRVGTMPFFSGIQSSVQSAIIGRDFLFYFRNVQLGLLYRAKSGTPQNIDDIRNIDFNRIGRDIFIFLQLCFFTFFRRIKFFLLGTRKQSKIKRASRSQDISYSFCMGKRSCAIAKGRKWIGLRV